MTDAFVVEFGCGNCGNEWKESYPPRTFVGHDPSQGAVISRNKDCDQLGTMSCDCCDIIVCPVCELVDDVEVIDRRPAEGAGGADSEKQETQA